jgi:phosphoglycerate dehydrogenase-like enzyme
MLLRGTGVRVTSSAGVHAEPMADWVLGAVLHFTRGFDIAVRAQAAGRWAKEAFTDGGRRFPELDQLRVAILGLGGIGQAVARRFAALGSTVRGIRRHPERAVPGVVDVLGPDRLLDIARVSDVLVVATPGTAETEHLVDGELLAALPEGALLVNVSRGRCVDEHALLAALDRGQVGGAAMDVFREEPLPSDHPLWRHPRVLVSPHVSSVTDRYWEREAELLVDNVSRYVDGRALVNLVDLEAGY